VCGPLQQQLTTEIISSFFAKIIALQQFIKAAQAKTAMTIIDGLNY